MTGFADHFSGHASEYAAARPTYPGSLFDWLAAKAPDRSLAWDVATGNGQAALELAQRFDRVVATDASSEQIVNATPNGRVTYRVEAAESTSFGNDKVSLATVAQAFHWFDAPRFWKEAQRVLKPGGVIAIWCYQLAEISPAVDGVVDHLYRDIVGDYWPLGRKQVELGYGELEFPLTEIEAPAFSMSADWTLERMLAYLQTWSAVQRYISDKGKDPVALIRDRLELAWGDSTAARTVRWPLSLRVGIC